jgi:hypothetical protein
LQSIQISLPYYIYLVFSTDSSQLSLCHLNKLTASTLENLCSAFSKLTSLRLYRCTSSLFQTRNWISKCSAVKELDFHNCRELDTLTFLAPLHQLERLNVHNCFLIQDPQIQQAATLLTNLRSLNLKGCWRIRDVSILCLSAACTKLQQLDIEGLKQVTSKSISTLAMKCTQLQTLNFKACNGIRDSGISALFTHCASSIQWLSLKLCEAITDKAFADMGNGPFNLTHLDLQGKCFLTNLFVTLANRMHKAHRHQCV